MRTLQEFYKVGYVYQGKHQWAVYFQLKSAQEAMMKMISSGMEVTGLESQKIIMGDNLKGVPHNKRFPN